MQNVSLMTRNELQLHGTTAFLQVLVTKPVRKSTCKPSLVSIFVVVFTLCLYNANIGAAWLIPSKYTQFHPCSPRVGGERYRRHHTPSHQQRNADTGDVEYITSILQEHRYDRRLITISSSYLPLLVEIFDNGQAHVCLLSEVEYCPNDDKEPKFQIKMGDGSVRVVDVGQITTIWEEDPADENWKTLSEESSTRGLKDDPFPVGHVEHSIDGLYRSRVGQARSSSSSLTKKQVSKLVAEAPANQENVERILRHVIKAGTDFGRLVDSLVAMEALFKKSGNTKHDNQDSKGNFMKRRAVGAYVLAHDAKMGGRFKRMPCTLVSHSTYGTDVDISIINGGWLVLDQSVRAGEEARKFTQRSSSTSTAADERIVQRLECLAMGEAMGPSRPSETEDLHIELDVRETLKAMGLPLSPQGAKDALLQIGRWSQNDSSSGARINPWPQGVLQAAEWYQGMDRKMQSELLNMIQETKAGAGEIDGRVDLTRLPCVCVDAQKTSFRDDAIGVRPRSMTGRKVQEEASKWEILVHIADVSDIFSPITSISDPSGNLPLLRDAALSRGTSRYDLPLGPLHLMPPTVLQALALTTINPDLTDKKSRISLDRPTTNRCVTLWAYIDERSGKLLDAGIERTIISCPLALSFKTATELLDDSLNTDDPTLIKAKSVLKVAERSLQLWNQYHMQRNEAARNRESRMNVKEMVSKEVNRYDNRKKSFTDQGNFQRSRGHRLVDSSLELYGYAVGTLVRRAKGFMPRVSGGGALRIATGPLRRYVDGMAQRQALSVLCGYGGDPMTKEECIEVGKAATEAINAVSNIKSVKKGTGNVSMPRHDDAYRTLKAHLASDSGPLPAMGTGKRNQVAILGIGAIANCRGIKGSLKPGERVMVKVIRMDDRTGAISTELVST